MHNSTNVLNSLTRILLLAGCWICSFLPLSAQPEQKTTEVDSQRYLALMLLNLTDPDNIGPEPDLIRTAANYGMNAVYITIPWDKVYFNSPSETPQWAKYDQQIKIATDLGMKVALRIHLGRHTSRIKGFWEVSDSQFSHSNLPLISGYLDTFFGFDNQPIVDKGAAFVKETIEHYKYLSTAKKLLYVSVTNTSTQEGEYPSGLIVNGRETAAVYDYSKSMTTGFRAFLKSHYTKIQRLNYLWGTTFKTFEEAGPPATGWEPTESFRQRYGKDWYIYRHQVFKKYMEQMISAVKSVDPSIKFVADYGSIFDGASVVRGTQGYKDLNAKADGIKVNDDFSTDHRWSVDLIKSDAPASFITANELFVNSYIDNNAHAKHINDCFSNGANVIAAVVSTIDQMTRAEIFLRPAASTWLNSPIPTITYSDTISYRLSAAVEKKGALAVIYDEWAKRAYANPASPKPVAVRLQEDLLSPDYWKDASNYSPYVFRPVPMQIIAVNRDFTYKLPIDTFSDVDGTIVKLEVGSLPSWLQWDGVNLRGRPNALGDYRITVRGIDDEGGSAEAFFTVRVDTRENANKPPTVDSNFSNQMVAINKPFSIAIPTGAFKDSDGSITKIEATELPAWIKFTNGTLTGTPTQLGEYRIILKAYDDLNAFVETYFTIRVVEPQFLNAPPFASSNLPVKYAQINMPFNYILPNNIFGDTDGYISSISVVNRPSWLDFSLNVFSGTPTEEGEYRLIIRAYDNGGAYVEIPFIILAQIPELRFELVKGGSKVDQSVIRKLDGDDILAYDSLPSLLNIYAYGNFEYDNVTFDLNGPYRKRSTTKAFPYALYENESGFAPYVGNYTLTVTASKEDSAIVTNSIQFSISYKGSVNITKDMQDWAFYPNPVEEILNVKLPESQPADSLSYEIFTASGKRIPLATSYVVASDNLANIDLTGLGLPSGIYFVRVESNGEFLKQFKIFKK
ncbi:putative Ig domain-containing protein [Dyadobacter luticola]|uniref:T9SS type A sorting domain-containing protein n=1 Tax=Dyadobacter luticola TaxID=1979387 RepID=A0A5R9KP39_9BACT|nr:putative Ig domain-containing protein [Dyadobacter luticola]TLU97973.1 T9SS type A sorting domain-containing protein [Dyadobacter luticola]